MPHIGGQTRSAFPCFDTSPVADNSMDAPYPIIPAAEQFMENRNLLCDNKGFGMEENTQSLPFFELAESIWATDCTQGRQFQFLPEAEEEDKGKRFFIKKR